MVAQAASGKKPLPEMMTSIRIDKSGEVEIVDQLLLPHEVKWLPISTPDQAYDAIKSMRIRGAPAIASLAALSLERYLSSPSWSAPSSLSSLKEELEPILDKLNSARPTAVNLSEAIGRIRRALNQGQDGDNDKDGGVDVEGTVQRVKETCRAVHAEDLARCMLMGKKGAEWLWEQRRGSGSGSGSASSQGGANGHAQEGEKRGLKVITVCNTGSLATSGYGTAIGVITSLFEEGHLERAYYAQTTPYHQGSRLTSLELTTLQIPASMICDTMLGSLLSTTPGGIDGIIVGADRIVSNGDTANKVGTYQAAVLAARHNVPFLVVAPVTTVDLSLQTGAEIEIEQRPAIEATQVRGRDIQTGELRTVRITPEGVGEGKEAWQGVFNPAFDVTPAELISCVVTEKGVAVRKEGEKSIDVASVC